MEENVQSLLGRRLEAGFQSPLLSHTVHFRLNKMADSINSLYPILRPILILNIFLIFSSLCARSLVRGIKNGHLIGRRNDITANMAALVLYICLAASRFLEAKTLRASQFGSPRRVAYLRRRLLLLSGVR